jgi:hypothetical protein
MAESPLVICDACGAVVTENLTRLAVETGSLRSQLGWEQIELCEVCSEQVSALLGQRHAQPVVSRRVVATVPGGARP